MEKQFLNLKLKCLLPVEVYKVADILMATQKEGYVTYSTINTKSLHMPQEAVEKALQTLVDRQIFDSPVKEGKFYKFRINSESLKRYNDSSWDDINNAPVMRLAEDVKFTKEQAPATSEFSQEELMAAIKALRAAKAAKEKKITGEDDLPW